MEMDKKVEFLKDWIERKMSKHDWFNGVKYVDIESFKDYLYSTTKFDTPSSTRHGFGSIFKERDGRLYFKLNLQLRYK